MRAHFDLDDRIIYLNNGTLSITPREVMAAIERHARDSERNPTQALMDTWGVMWRVQGEVASFFGARAADFFLRPNVTGAMNDFVLGVTLPTGGEILATNLEYGAMLNLCRYRAERDGMSLRLLDLPATAEEALALTPELLVKRIVADLKPETRMLLVSHVMTGTGLVVPLRKLAQETRMRDILLVVDGAHAPGAVDVDFGELEDVDFYGGNLHKWMFGPKGTGFGWVPKRHHERVRPIQAGWTTFETPTPFKDFGGGERFATRMLMSNCLNFAPYFALSDLLRLRAKLGERAIRARLQELRAFAAAEMARAVPWACISPQAPALRGPLLSYDLPPKLEKEGYGLMERLLAEKGLQIAVSPVQGRFRLRLSPQIYNTEDEIARGVAILGGLGT